MRSIILFMSIIISITLIAADAAAIVNMDSLHFNQSSNGNSGEFSIGFSGATGNTDKSQINIDSQFKMTSQQYSNIILANYQRGESKDVVDTNKRFVHLRHIHTTSNPKLAWELFLQSETNVFTRLSLRTLLGSGIRYIFNKDSSTRNFIGAGGFYARETLEKTTNLIDDGTTNSVRANIYLLSRVSLSDTATLYNTLYYQPDIESFNDFRAFNISALKVKIVKKLSLKI
jgi:hypothetical protein